MISLRAGKRDEVVGELKRLGIVGAVDAQLSLWIGLHAHQRNRLPETSFGARAFQSHRLKLLGDVQRSELPAFRTRASPLETVIGKKLDVRAQSVFADGAWQGLSTGRNSLRHCVQGKAKKTD